MQGRPVALGVLDQLDGPMFAPAEEPTGATGLRFESDLESKPVDGESPSSQGETANGSSGPSADPEPDKEADLPPLKIMKLSSPALVSAECRKLVVVFNPAKASPLEGGKQDTRSLPPLAYSLQIQELKIKPGKEKDPLQRIDQSQWAEVADEDTASLEREVPGLKPGLRYALRVSCQLQENGGASNGVVQPLPGMPEPSDPVLLCTTAAPPSAPTPVTLCSKERKALKFKWPVPEETGGYEELKYTLELSPPPDVGATAPEVAAATHLTGSEDFVVVYQGPDMSFKVTKLAPGVKYSVRASAENSLGQGPCSFVGEFRTAAAVPQRPDAPQAIAKGQTTVLLRWTMPHDNGAEITRMHVQQARAGSPEGEWVDVACMAGLECEVQGLRPAETYMFRLCCENDIGRSLFSAAAEVRTAAAPPRPPGAAVASELTQHSANLAWGEPVWDGGAPVMGYEVQLFPRSPAALMGGLQANWVTVFSGPDTKCAILGLRGGCRYSIRTRCMNSAGSSDYSTATEFGTAAEAPEAMWAPRVVSFGQTSLDLAWEPPAFDGGAPVQQYYVSVWNPATQAWDPSYTGPGLMATVGPLNPNSDYTFRVWCSNRVGTSPSSEVTTVSTLAAPPLPMDSPSIASITSSGVQVSWPDPGLVGGLPVIKYALEKAMLGPDNENIAFKQVYEGPGCSVDVKGLLPNSEYGFRVRAANAAGQGSWGPFCVCRTAAAPPGKPDAVEVIFQGPDELCLGWSAPAEDNGAPVSSYLVEMNSSRKGLGAGAWVQVHQGPEASCTVTGLLPGRPYAFRVRADNKAGAGGFSTPFSCSTAAAVPPPPPAPTFGRHTAHSVVVKWEAPGHDNGAPVAAFRVQVAEAPNPAAAANGSMLHASKAGGAGGEVLLVPEAALDLEWLDAYSGAGGSAKIEHLQAGTVYAFRVLAANEVGDGPWGPPAATLTSLAPPQQMSAPAVSPVSSQASDNPHPRQPQLTVSWQPPAAEASCALPVSYEVEAVEVAGLNGGGVTRQVVTARKGSLQCFVSGLSGDCDFHVRVRAVGAGGTGHGPWSEASTARTPPDRDFPRVEAEFRVREESNRQGTNSLLASGTTVQDKTKKGSSRTNVKQRSTPSARSAIEAEASKQPGSARGGSAKGMKAAAAKPPPRKDRWMSKKAASYALQVVLAVFSIGFLVFLCMLAAKTQWRPDPNGSSASKSYLEREWEVAYSREREAGYIALSRQELFEILEAAQHHMDSGGSDIPPELLRRAEKLGIDAAMMQELMQLQYMDGQPHSMVYDDPPQYYDQRYDDY